MGSYDCRLLFGITLSMSFQRFDSGRFLGGLLNVDSLKRQSVIVDMLHPEEGEDTNERDSALTAEVMAYSWKTREC